MMILMRAPLMLMLLPLRYAFFMLLPIFSPFR